MSEIVFGYPAQFLAGLLLGGYFGAFSHELGHALLGRWMGYEITSFGVGLAHPLFVCRWGETRVYVCLHRADNGLTFGLFPEGQPTKRQQVGFLSGGPLANLTLALAGMLLWLAFGWAATFWLTFTGFNVLMSIMALLPHQYRFTGGYLASDGRQILQVLRGQPQRSAVFSALYGLRRFRGLWEAIDDRRIQAHYLQVAAMVWMALDDSQYADELMREAGSLTTQRRPMMDAMALLVRADADHKAGRVDSAAEGYEKARQLFVTQEFPNGRIAAMIGQTKLATEMGKPAEATRLLTEIEGDPCLIESPGLRAPWLYARLELLRKSSSVEELAQMRVQYESVPDKTIPEISDWNFYRLLAKTYIERSELSAAEELCDLACKAAVKLWQALPSPQDRDRFAAVAAEFQQQTRDLLKQLGKEDAASAVANLFTDVTKKAAKQAKRQRDRKLLGWGLGLTAFNVATLVLNIAVMVNLHLGSQLFVLFFFLSLLLGGFVLVTVVYQLMYLLLINRAKEVPGTMTLAFAASPWILLLGGAIFFWVVGLMK
jgi:hypothetical protein